MCTAVNMCNNERSYFGRTMDLPYYFNQSPILIPKGHSYLNRAKDITEVTARNILGMGCIIDGHPAMAEAMNDAGLACAGLNFPGYAHFDTEKSDSMENICPYDFIIWALSSYDSVEEVKKAAKNIKLLNIPLNSSTPVSALHWMLCDKQGKSIVVENTAGGLNIYDNPVGVMTNSPEFPWHLTNLREYLTVSPQHPNSISWSDLKLSPLGVGIGGHGLPGDYSAVSRFVRAAFLRSSVPTSLSSDNELAQFFSILDACSMPKGSVKTAEGHDDFTSYASCMDLNNGIYYYKCYENNRINAVRFQDLATTNLQVFPYNNKQDILYLN